MTRNQMLSAFFMLLLLFLFVQAVAIFSPFIPMIFCAAFLAFGFHPLYEFFGRRLRVSEDMAASLTLICIVLAVVPLLILLAFHLSEQVLDLLHQTLAFVREGRFNEMMEKMHSIPWIQHLETRLATVRFVQENLHNWIVDMAKILGNFTLKQLGEVTRNVVYFSLGFLLTLFLVFAFLRHGRTIYRFLYEVTPLEEADKDAIFRQIRETTSAVIHGQIVTSVVQAVCAGVVFYFLGLPVPLFAAAVTFLSSMVPIVGASLVWAPFVIYLLLKQMFVKAVLLLILGVCVISGVDNFLKPAIIGEKTRLPYFLLFLAVLGGLKVYGFLGIFLAPVVMSLFFALLKIYKEKYLTRV